MPGIIDFVVDQFLHNQFATAAILATPAAMITYSARAVPKAAWSGLKKLVSVELRFNSDMDNYFKVQDFVTRTVVMQNLSRNFTYRFEREHYPGSNGPQENSYVTMGYGNHLGKWRGKPVWIRRFQQESSATERFKESLEVVLVGRGVRRVQDFLAEMEKHLENGNTKRKTQVFTNAYDHWRRVGVLQPRPASTVITSHGQTERAVEYLRVFAEEESEYVRLGVPYHTGILLTGQPGTGKTSLIQALATETGRDLYYLNLASVTQEHQLAELMGRDWGRSILVLEDVDASRMDVDRNASEGNVSLATMLNLLDGILSPIGMVVVATTNRPEALDAALKRPGRFDLTLDLGPLQWEGFVRLAALYGYGPAQLSSVEPLYAPTTGAQARALLAGGLAAVRRHYGLDTPVDTAGELGLPV